LAKRERIYLDNAATSWPKPQSVIDAVCHHMQDLGAPAGRSGYKEANTVERLISDTRRHIGYLFGLTSPDHIIFGHNGTDVLNLCLHGFLRPGDHVVTTLLEHNSVLRPLSQLAEQHGVQVTTVIPGTDGRVSAEMIAEQFTSQTRLVVVSHASNVTGILQPVEEIFQAANSRGIRVLVDAAQTAGHVELNLGQTPIDMVAFSGHKGLLGPLGTGVAIFQPHMVNEIASQRQGGTGTKSEIASQPEDVPAKYESGNPNVPGILGLRASVEYLRDETITALHRGTLSNTKLLLEGLNAFSGVSVLGPPEMENRTGVVSIQVDAFDPHELATALDSAFGIQCRAGLHCAPRIHEHLGTIHSGGAVRFSLGIFNTAEQVEKTLAALKAILK